MFNLMKKKKDTIFFSPTIGKVVDIGEVNDPVFSKKILGEGYAIIPESNEVFSPVKGEIVSIFPTKHAISILTNAGDEVLIHMGIDTVALNGAPFKLFVKPGDIVDENSLLATMDLRIIEREQKESTIMIIFTNKENVKEFLLESRGLAQNGQYLGKVSH
ncbi:PTS glucose transporter subunit IIA [Robertmurraya sp.]|jgi:glucose-specific phosphotransferase system IIA component|uniref:PTS sugar transporter subunit IIA n=1 Tax=Robertmurraya sp. TaxID=2837525 RepID=UPI00370480B1